MTTFISYSRVNSDFAVQLAKDLKSAGYDVWLDQLDIPTGARWDDEIEKALDSCRTFLIVLSTKSIMSQNVKDEVGYAIDSGKHVLPVIIEPCKVPLRLRRFQFVDFANQPYEDSLTEIKNLLDNMDSTAATSLSSSRPHIKPIQRQMPESEKSNRTWPPALIVFAVCGVAMIGFIAILLTLPKPNVFFPATPIPPVLTPISSPISSPVAPTAEPTFTASIPPTAELTYTASAPSTVEPTSVPEGEYMSQESYSGDCANRLSGFVCIGYSDGFKWLINDAVQDRGDGGLWQDKKVEIMFGFKADYYHVLNTTLVKVVPK